MVHFTSTLFLAIVATLSAAAPVQLNNRQSATSATPAAGNGGFRLQNGKDAQKLNAQFASLTADAACTAPQTACIDGGFAQCIDGSFVVAECGGGLTCFALPLVNSAGTSVTCDTEADAIARIESTGATGGLTGDGTGSDDAATNNGDNADSDDSATEESAAGTSTAATPASSSSGSADSDDSATEDTAAGSSTAATPTSTSGDFKLENGKAAQALNAQFAGLSASDSCEDGDTVCVDGKFAQCANGKFALTNCGTGLQCVALPLVNKPGTSVTCDTEEDALFRINNTGATGGLTG